MKRPKIDLSEASTEDLERELARRRAKEAPFDMTAMELAVGKRKAAKQFNHGVVLKESP